MLRSDGLILDLFGRKRMLNANLLLDRARDALNLRSDAQLAKRLGVASSFVCDIRKGHRRLTDWLIIELYEALGEAPYSALIEYRAEKAEGKEREAYQAIAAIIRDKAA